jgi:hypothetical protein
MLCHVRSATLRFHALVAPTRSARIRTGVNELMTRFERSRDDAAAVNTGLRIPVIPATQSSAKRFRVAFGETGWEPSGHSLPTLGTARPWTLALRLLPCPSPRMPGVMIRYAARPVMRMNR